MKKIINIIYGARGGGIDTITNQYAKFKSNTFVSKLRIIKKEKKNILQKFFSLIAFFNNVIDEKPRVVVCQGFQAIILFSIYKKIFFFKKKKNLIYISVYHGEYFDNPKIHSFKAKLVNYIYGFFLKASDEVIAVSNFSKKTLLKRYSLKSKVILNPIPNKFFYKNNTETKRLNKKLTLVAVSRFDPIKRTLFLVNIIKILRLKMPNIELKIIGNGYQFKEVSNFIKKSQLERHVKLIGWKKNTAKYLNKSMYYISCSLIENLSPSLIEAMSENCIPIVNKVGGNPEVISNNINGYIFKMNNLKNTSSIIYKILKRKKINSNNIRKSINAKFSPKKFNNELGKFLSALDFIY